MTFLLYLAGLIIGIAIFLWLLSTYHQGIDKIKEIKEGKIKEEPGLAEKIQLIQKQDFNRHRTCPLCGATLTKYEALYAATVKIESGQKIMICSCRYCYRPEEKPDEPKQTDITGIA
jgi:rubredoxin